MRRSHITTAALRAALAASILAGAAAMSTQAEVPRPSFFGELTAGPLFGLDRPLRGCSGELAAGFALAPFELGIGAGGAYDAALATGDLRFDHAVGLGSGLRAILGCLLVFGEPTLPGGDGSVAATFGDWPNRFGLAATIAELPFRIFGARPSIETELVYTVYRVKEATALTGAPAFAAGVEASLALELRWTAR